MRHEGLASLAGLLARYKRLKAPQGAVIAVFLTAVKEVCGLEIKKAVVGYRPATKTLSVALAGPLKNEIILNQKRILAECRKQLDEASTPRAIV